MTPRKVAVYLVAGTVLVAWFATAADVEQTPEPPVVPVPVQTSGTETLAEEVQAQTGRLRERLAAAPAPQQPARNPFAFAPKPLPRVRSSASAAKAAPMPLPTIVSEPVLTLVGLAEDQSPEGPIRTAIISAEGGEVLIVKAGEFIGARYRVQGIGADAVTLIDLTTNAVRRLALR
jgi:Tfp pilus assembly protein PilP